LPSESCRAFALRPGSCSMLRTLILNQQRSFAFHQQKGKGMPYCEQKDTKLR